MSLRVRPGLNSQKVVEEHSAIEREMKRVVSMMMILDLGIKCQKERQAIVNDYLSIESPTTSNE